MLPIRDKLPTRRTPYVTYLLILFNVLAFFWQSALIEAGYDLFVVEWGVVPRRFLASPGDEVVTLFSSMFLHGSWMHIGGNMLFLWIFGDNVEDAMGHGRYLAFYLAAGLAAAFAQVATDPYSAIPMLGASGAISGVLAAYGTLYPRSPITVVNPIPLLWLYMGLFWELPAWVIILEYFVGNLLSALGSVGYGGRGGVAFFAHLGGFLAGIVLVRLFMLGRGRMDYDRWHGLRQSVGAPYRRPTRRTDADRWW